MPLEESISIDTKDAISAIKRDELLTTLLCVADAGRRTLYTLNSKEGVFLGVFSGEIYWDKHVMVSNYSGSLENVFDRGVLVYDKDRELITFHARICRNKERSDNRFTWGPDKEEIEKEARKSYTESSYNLLKRLGLLIPEEFELKAFHPGNWQKHVQFIEKNLGYGLEEEEEFLGPYRLNEMFNANCFVP